MMKFSLRVAAHGITDGPFAPSVFCFGLYEIGAGKEVS